MNLPAMPVTAKSRDDCIELYLKRLSGNRAHSPHTSMLLSSYLTWPNDEEKRNSFAAAFNARFEREVVNAADLNSAEFTMFGGVAAIADAALDHLSGDISQANKRWLWVADIFQLIVDTTYDERVNSRRGPSISKAIDLCELEKGVPGHSQLRGAWSEFRDVAHLLTAAANLAHESTLRADKAVNASILNSIWLAPDVVLTMAYGLQVFGLQPKPIEKEQPFLRPDKVWQIPASHGPEKPFVVFRRLTDVQLDFLHSRRATKKAG
jgi:hypothetical protein